MPFQVIVRPRARLDIEATATWLARSSSVVAAVKWRNGLLPIFKELETDPKRYPVADEAADIGVDLRMLLYGRRRKVYRILFEIKGQTVGILRVRHASQDRLTPDDI